MNIETKVYNNKYYLLSRCYNLQNEHFFNSIQVQFHEVNIWWMETLKWYYIESNIRHLARDYSSLAASKGPIPCKTTRWQELYQRVVFSRHPTEHTNVYIISFPFPQFSFFLCSLGSGTADRCAGLKAAPIILAVIILHNARAARGQSLKRPRLIQAKRISERRGRLRLRGDDLINNEGFKPSLYRANRTAVKPMSNLSILYSPRASSENPRRTTLVPANGATLTICMRLSGNPFASHPPSLWFRANKHLS